MRPVRTLTGTAQTGTIKFTLIRFVFTFFRDPTVRPVRVIRVGSATGMGETGPA